MVLLMPSKNIVEEFKTYVHGKFIEESCFKEDYTIGCIIPWLLFFGNKSKNNFNVCADRIGFVLSVKLKNTM